MTIIDTPRLRLRPWDDKDAPELYELARDPRIVDALVRLPSAQHPDAGIAGQLKERGSVRVAPGAQAQALSVNDHWSFFPVEGAGW